MSPAARAASESTDRELVFTASIGDCCAAIAVAACALGSDESTRGLYPGSSAKLDVLNVPAFADGGGPVGWEAGIRNRWQRAEGELPRFPARPADQPSSDQR